MANSAQYWEFLILSKRMEKNALILFHPILNQSRKEFGLKIHLLVLKN